MGGAEQCKTFDVTAADTAVALGSGDVDVLATPRLLAWLESATITAAAPYLGEGETSVGVAVRIRHRRPTPVGGSVTVTADLAHRSGARLTFVVSAVDGDDDVVATGEIDRAIVVRAEFG